MSEKLTILTSEKKDVVDLLAIEIDDTIYRLSIRYGRSDPQFAKFISRLKNELQTTLRKIAGKTH